MNSILQLDTEIKAKMPTNLPPEMVEGRRSRLQCWDQPHLAGLGRPLTLPTGLASLSHRYQIQITTAKWLLSELWRLTPPSHRRLFHKIGLHLNLREVFQKEAGRGLRINPFEVCINRIYGVNLDIIEIEELVQRGAVTLSVNFEGISSECSATTTTATAAAGYGILEMKTQQNLLKVWRRHSVVKCLPDIYFIFYTE